MANKVGVIESVDEAKKIINFAGYGEYIGEFDIPNDVLEEEYGFSDIPVSASKIRLENGREIWASGAVWYSDEESMRVTLEEYEAEGYTIKHDAD